MTWTDWQQDSWQQCNGSAVNTLRACVPVEWKSKLKSAATLLTSYCAAAVLPTKLFALPVRSLQPPVSRQLVPLICAPLQQLRTNTTQHTQATGPSDRLTGWLAGMLKRTSKVSSAYDTHQTDQTDGLQGVQRELHTSASQSVSRRVRVAGALLARRTRPFGRNCKPTATRRCQQPASQLVSQ
jgi:hypothetical protein